jgi:hypothetical protein
MTLENREQGAELAARLLRYPVEEALAHSTDLPDLDAWYFWQPVRGGGQIIVARDGSVMFGVSSLTLEDMVGYFSSGMRTDPSLFPGA